MKLLTAELRAQLPALYTTDGQGYDAIAWAKFFTPDSNWSWYATEFDGADQFFGLVEGLEIELGYFTLSELEGARGPWGLPIERDHHWRPRPLADVRNEIEARRGGGEA